MKHQPFKFAVSLGLTAALLFHAVLPAFAAGKGDDEGRIKPAKTKEKGAKRGTIEIENDTGQEANDFHIAFRPSLPTIEKIRVNGKDPFPSGYRPRGTQAGLGPPWADFGRQKGDSSVKDGDTIKIDIAWTEDMPEIAYFVWTKDGEKLTAKEGAAEQKPEIKGKDADAARKAKADAEAKAKKEADAAAKKEAEEAEKAAKDGDKGVQKSIGGVLEGQVVSEAGTVRVRLPDAMRAGDTIVGTVLAEPAGRTPEEKRRNADVLGAMVLDWGGSKTLVKERKFSWTLPPADRLTLTLSDPSGGSKRSFLSIPLAQPGSRSERAAIGISTPPAAQTGKPFAIGGAFDPSKPTQVVIGGKPAEILAESPRSIHVEMPFGLAGPQEIAVHEDGKAPAKGQISAIDIRLSAPKTTLMKGERTTIRVEVRGLEALNFASDRLEVYFDPAYIIIQNDSPDAVEFFGPGSEPFDGTVLPKPKPSISRSIKIMPRMLDPQGRFVRELTLRATASGPFSISGYFCLEGDFDGLSRPTSNRTKPPTR